MNRGFYDLGFHLGFDLGLCGFGIRFILLAILNFVLSAFGMSTSSFFLEPILKPWLLILFYFLVFLADCMITIFFYQIVYKYHKFNLQFLVPIFLLL